LDPRSSRSSLRFLRVNGTAARLLVHVCAAGPAGSVELAPSLFSATMYR
jgi:hypothetical protein